MARRKGGVGGKQKKFGIEALPLILLVLGFLAYLFATAVTDNYLHSLQSRFGSLGPVFERTTLKETFLALVIAALATVSIESVRVRRWMKDIDDFVRVLAIRGPLPTDYYEHCRRAVLEIGFLQTDWTIRMSLTPLAESPQFLSLKFDQEYKVTNLETVENQYPVHHFESRDWDDRWPQYPTRIRYIRAKLDGSSDWLLNVEGEEANQVDPENADHVRFQKEIPIEPSGVLSVYEGSVKIMRDREVETTLIEMPTKGVNIIAEYPNDLEVSFTVFHPKAKLAKYIPAEDLGEGRLRLHWSFNQPLHPWSVIGIEWSRRGAQAQAPMLRGEAPIREGP